MPLVITLASRTRHASAGCNISVFIAIFTHCEILPTQTEMDQPRILCKSWMQCSPTVFLSWALSFYLISSVYPPRRHPLLHLCSPNNPFFSYLSQAFQVISLFPCWYFAIVRLLLKLLSGLKRKSIQWYFFNSVTKEKKIMCARMYLKHYKQLNE